MGYEQCDSLEFFGGLGWVLLWVSVWSWWVFWACLFFKLFLNIYILIYILPVGLSLTRIAGDFGRDVLRGGRRGGWLLVLEKKSPSFALKFGGKIQVDK